MDDIQLVSESLITKTEHAEFEDLEGMAYTVSPVEVKEEEEDDVLPPLAAVTLHPIKEEEEKDHLMGDPLRMPDREDHVEETSAFVCQKEPSDADGRSDLAGEDQRKCDHSQQKQLQRQAAMNLAGGPQVTTFHDSTGHIMSSACPAAAITFLCSFEGSQFLLAPAVQLPQQQIPLQEQGITAGVGKSHPASHELLPQQQIRPQEQGITAGIAQVLLVPAVQPPQQQIQLQEQRITAGTGQSHQTPHVLLPQQQIQPREQGITARMNQFLLVPAVQSPQEQGIIAGVAQSHPASPLQPPQQQIPLQKQGITAGVAHSHPASHIQLRQQQIPLQEQGITAGVAQSHLASHVQPPQQQIPLQEQGITAGVAQTHPTLPKQPPQQEIWLQGQGIASSVTQERHVRYLQRLQERRMLSAQHSAARRKSHHQRRNPATLEKFYQRRAAWRKRQKSQKSQIRSHDARKTQLIEWRRAKEGRLVRGGGSQKKRQQKQEQQKRHPRNQQVQPLTRKEQAVIENVLSLQASWTNLHVTRQQDSHAHHVAAVTRVLDATVRELREKFPAENIPNSNALTETILNLITNSGLNPKALVIFLQKLGIIKDTALCPRQWHTEPAKMVLYTRSKGAAAVVTWRCYHKIEGRRCGKTQSVYQGTIFEGCNVPTQDKLFVILKLLRHQCYADIMNDVPVGPSAINLWRNQCRQYFKMYGNTMHRIGGPGTIVEIGKTHIDKRMYSDESPDIVLGGVERNTGKTFMVQIPDESAMTLCSVIVQFVAPGGTVVTDQYAGYNALRCLGYTHHVVCPKTDFVNPQVPEAYTNTIEGKWSHLKRFLREHTSTGPTVSLQYRLGEYLFYNDCINDQVEPSIKFLSLLRAEM